MISRDTNQRSLPNKGVYDMAEAWMKFGVAEGGTKAASRTLSKLIGFSSGTMLGVVLAGVIDGLIQMIGGWLLARRRQISLAVTRAQLAGALGFGLVATAMTIIGTYVFTYPGADVGVTTLIVISSIVPGALVDRFFFGHSLAQRQWWGIVIFLLAVWAILDFPPLVALYQLPDWVLWTMPLPLLAVVNEAITQWQGHGKIRKLGSMVNNFWIGATTTIVTISILLTFMVGRLPEIFNYPSQYWVGSLLRGLLVIAMVAFKLMAYQMGGTIAKKKFVMQSSQLILAMLLGVIFFHEAFTSGKLIAIPLVIIGFSLIDDESWQFLRQRVKKLI